MYMLVDYVSHINEAYRFYHIIKHALLCNVLHYLSNKHLFIIISICIFLSSAYGVWAGGSLPN